MKHVPSPPGALGLIMISISACRDARLGLSDCLAPRFFQSLARLSRTHRCGRRLYLVQYG